MKKFLENIWIIGNLDKESRKAFLLSRQDYMAMIKSL
mgnify:CR=1 FL=1